MDGGIGMVLMRVEVLLGLALGLVGTEIVCRALIIVPWNRSMLSRHVSLVI